MARISLNDLSSFLNCRFRRSEVPFEKVSGCLFPKRPDAACLVLMNRREGIWSWPLGSAGSGKSSDCLGEILVHAPARQATRNPGERLRAGVVVFLNPQGRHDDLETSTIDR